MSDIKSYSSEKITITWDKAICFHSEVCLKNLPEVFNLKNRPWVNPDGDETDAIKDLISKCPSGALAFKMAGNHDPETPAHSDTTITIVSNGPLRIKGGFDLIDNEGKRLDHKSVVSLCRCGASKNKPFCDGSHKEIDFKG